MGPRNLRSGCIRLTGRFSTSQSGKIYGERRHGENGLYCYVDTRVCSHSPTITRHSASGNYYHSWRLTPKVVLLQQAINS